MAAKQIDKGSFWATIISSVGILSAALIFYHPYEGKNRAHFDRIENQEEQQLAQLEIKKMILENQLAQQSLEDQLAIVVDSPNEDQVLLAENTPSTQPSLQTKKQEAEIAPTAMEASTSQEFTFASITENTIVSEEPNTPSEARQFELLAGLNKRFLKNPSPSSLETRSTEFSRVPFCKSLGWYIGVTAGADEYVNQRDYNAIIQSHVHEYHEAIEQSELMSSRELSRTQFNAGIYGGVRLFNRLDIEGGAIYHHSNQTYTSVYRNLLREEFLYIEWVPTGATSGPNSRPVYRPVESTDFYYSETIDSVKTQAQHASVELPLVFRYNLRWKKLSLFASLGSSATLLSNYKVTTVDQRTGESTQTEDTQMGVSSINGLLGAGIAYEFIPGMEIRLEPMFRPNLYTDQQLLEGFGSNSSSVNAGITYRF